MTDYTELKPLLEACRAENCNGPREFRKAVEALFDACTVETISALIAENDRISARLCVCRDCGGQGEIYSGHSSYQGHNQPPEPEMDVCGACGGDGVLGPLEDFESLAAERDQLKAENEIFEEGMRSLASTLGAGGYNAETLTATQLVEKVQWGVNHLADVSGRLADDLRAEVAGLKTGYEAYERVNAELKAENEALLQVLVSSHEFILNDARTRHMCDETGHVSPLFPKRVGVLSAIAAAIGKGEQS